MKFRIIILLSFLLMNCSSPTDKVDEIGPNITGVWVEEFSWSDPFNSVILENTADEYGLYSYTETSTITFLDESFAITIDPPSRGFIYEDDSLYIGFLGDTLYSGLYEVRSDSILFYRSGMEDAYTALFVLTDSTLLLTALANPMLYIFEGDTSSLYSVAPFSFIWGNAWFKSSGLFEKISDL